jgi:hypothetical protein
MDSAEEKKWFIYVGDHHEGPFSLNDLRGKMSQGIISDKSYTWAEGMADWQVITEVQPLSPLFSSGPVSPTQEQASLLAMEVPPLASDGAVEAIAPPVADSPAQPMSVSLAESVSEPSSPRSSYTDASERSGLSNGGAAAAASVGVGSVVLADVPAGVQRHASDYPGLSSKKSKSKSRKRGKALMKVMKLLLVLAVVAGVGYAYGQGAFDPVLRNPTVKAMTSRIHEFAMPRLVKLTEKAPFLAKWISPIPTLPDESAEDYEELRQAAIARPESTGAKFSVALSKTSAAAPVFYVSANLEDGARLKIVLTGVAETLLDSTGYNQSIPVTMAHRFSVTDPYKPIGGAVLPRGQYLVTLVEALDNPAKEQVAKIAPSAKPGEKPGVIRVLAAKSYFLGGVKDPSYSAQLKTFHETIVKKASEELIEVKAYSDHFDKQLSESTQRFEAVHKAKKIVASKKKMWSDFHSKWMKSWGQMDQVFSKWTPESIKTERFYSGLYAQLTQVAQSVEKVHQFQDSFIAGTGDRKAVEIQLGEAQSAASAAVTGLKARVEQIEKAATPAGGIPLREDQIQ